MQRRRAALHALQPLHKAPVQNPPRFLARPLPPKAPNRRFYVAKGRRRSFRGRVKRRDVRLYGRWERREMLFHFLARIDFFFFFLRPFSART